MSVVNVSAVNDVSGDVSSVNNNYAHGVSIGVFNTAPAPPPADVDFVDRMLFGGFLEKEGKEKRENERVD